MQKLWSAYIDGDLSLDVSLKKAYALQHNLNIGWVDMTEELVGDYVQRLLSELEQAGHDLDITPLDILQDKFIKVDISINPPPGYIQLSEALDTLKLQLSQSAENRYPETMIAQLIEIKEKIEIELKSMK